MNVTLICDASFCSDTQIGAWACWIRSQRGVKKVEGKVFRNPCPNSNAAEMQAAVNALHTGLIEGIIQDGDAVLIEMDSLDAIQALMGAYPRRHAEILGRFNDLANRFHILWEFRHVPAHCGTSTKRTYVHDRCDVWARAAMRLARDNYRNGPDQSPDGDDGVRQAPSPLS